MWPALWSSYDQVVETMLRTVLIYAGAVIALRIVGRRTLAQMSAFDIVVTIAIGSTIASAVVPSSPAVSDGLAALVALLICQVTVATLRQRFPRVQRTLDFTARVIFRDGAFAFRRSPTSAQLTSAEVHSMLRQKGVLDLRDVEIVILEPTGNVSVVPRDASVDRDLIGQVDGAAS